VRSTPFRLARERRRQAAYNKAEAQWAGWNRKNPSPRRGFGYLGLGKSVPAVILREGNYDCDGAQTTGNDITSLLGDQGNFDPRYYLWLTGGSTVGNAAACEGLRQLPQWLD
jgi:hypothetical protein